MGRKATLREEYFSWLCGLVSKDKRWAYHTLCKELHKKEFRWFVPNDDNRCEDGLRLRDRFIEENNIDETHLEVRYFLKDKCTVFEVLVALAYRMDDQMHPLNDSKPRIARWFTEMIRNLRLDGFYDGCDGPVTEAEIDEILENFMDRTYDEYGNGGLFPLKTRPRNDQTKVEIWYQLMLYLDENYGR